MSRRFARAGWPRTSEMVSSITITASATPHAEGAYTQILASTAADVCGIVIKPLLVSGAGVDTSMLLTLAVGAAASEVDVVANVMQGGVTPSFAGFFTNLLWLPIHIPAGSRVAGKLRAEQVSDTYEADYTFLESPQLPGWGGYAACETFGADTANSKGTDISNTAGTWTQISASTASPLRAFSISVGLVDLTAATVVHTVDVGVGGAGSEQVIGTWQVRTSSSEQVLIQNGPPFIERPIAAGSRLAIKKSTTDDLSAAIHGWS